MIMQNEKIGITSDSLQKFLAKYLKSEFQF